MYVSSLPPLLKNSHLQVGAAERHVTVGNYSNALFMGNVPIRLLVNDSHITGVLYELGYCSSFS